MRQEFSAKVKVLAFKRSGGLCEKCGAKLFPGNVEYDHDNPCGLTGSNGIGNCVVLCRACHRAKTGGDVRNIAQAKRRERSHLGAKSPKGRPMMGSKRSGFRRKMNGEIVRRSDDE